MAPAIAGLPSAPRRAWILSPVQDTLFVIAAPPLVLVAAVALFALLGAAAATAYILLLHVCLRSRTICPRSSASTATWSCWPP